MDIQIKIDEAKLREQLEASVGTIVRRVNWSSRIEEEAIKLSSQVISDVVRETIEGDGFKEQVRKDFRREVACAIQKLASGVAKHLLHDIVNAESAAKLREEK